MPTRKPEAKQLLSQAEQRIFSILDSRSTSVVASIREILHEAMDRMEARMKGEHAMGAWRRVCRSRSADRGPAQFGTGHSGGPAEHGQDGPGHEYCRTRCLGAAGAHPVCQPRNVVDRIGRPPVVFRRSRQRPSPAQRHHFQRGPRPIDRKGQSLSKAPLFVDDSPARRSPRSRRPHAASAAAKAGWG